MVKLYDKLTRFINWKIFIGFIAFSYGFYSILFYTPHDIGVTHDSINYLNVAKQFINGNGFYKNVTGEFEPLTTFQPFYSFVLGVLSFNYFEPVTIARYLNAILFGFNIVLGGMLAYRASGKNIMAYLIALLAIALSHPLHITHFHAWTEPLFIALLFSSFLLLDSYFLRPASKQKLLIAGLLMALAIFTRYAGLIALPVSITAIVLYQNIPLLARIKDLIIYSLPCLIILGAWLIRNSLLIGNPVDRNLKFLGIKQAKIDQMQSTLKSWFFSNAFDDQLGFWMSLILIIGIIVSGMVYNVYHRQRKISKLPGLLGFFSISYWVFVLATIIFVDPVVPLNQRLLLPLFLCVVILLSSMAFNNHINYQLKKLVLLVSFMASVFWISHLWDFNEYFKKVSYNEGYGFSKVKFDTSNTISTAKGLPEKALYFAPTFDHLYFHYLINRPVKPKRSIKRYQDSIGKKQAYLLFLNECCKNNEEPQLPVQALSIDPIETGHIYEIKLEKSATD